MVNVILRQALSCVTLKSAHLFRGNPVAPMFQLRFRAVIERQEWDVPTWQHMEYDEFDNPATTYFLWRDQEDAVRGCARLYPTDRPYMLKKAFSFLVTDGALPENDMAIWEGSRLCVGGGEKGYQNGGEVVPCQGSRSA